MNRFLPSKKLSVFLGVILVVLVCFFVFFEFKNERTSYFTNTQTKTVEVVTKEIQQVLKNDSDDDGLKDWEEILWKTDPNNPDTDGDGTDDNSEILSNRDPLTAGPNDILGNKITTTEDTQSEAQERKPLTQTEILSRELFTGYVALKQNNQLGTTKEEQLIDNLITRNLLLNINSVKKNTLGDLNIIENHSRETLLQYVNELTTIINLGHDLVEESTLIKTALETKNEKDLDKLNLNLKIYTKMKDLLLTIEVPSIISSIHLDGINNLNDLINDVSDMLLVFEDPIRGLKGVENYFDDVIKASTNSIKMIDYFNKIDIKFNL
ncbi:MAG: hypothetical protein U9P50_01900 [Patescibacteria group bacterium]|nr:hypothetical protein [Patescibacteria group bacterium]